MSFDSYEAAWVELSKYQRFGLSKLRNYFELRDIHEIRMVYNELFTRKKYIKKQNDLVSKTFEFYFSNIFLPY